MTRRRLSSEEIELWKKVTDTAQKLHPNAKHLETPKPKPTPTKSPRPRAPEFQISGGKAPLPHDLVPTLRDQFSKAPVKMDRKAFTKMQRGKLVPEGKIDLHGMTMDQAHSALNRFISRAYSSQKRLVLVITGKGRITHDDGPIPVRHGILKHHVPQWLAMAPLGPMILQVTQAHIKHGGSGAYYVYLRRHR